MHNLIVLDSKERHCGFCGRPESEVFLVHARPPAICDGCLDMSVARDSVRRVAAELRQQPQPELESIVA